MNQLTHHRNDIQSQSTFWDSLPRPIIGLAPMDGVGDHPFRHIQKKYGNPAIMYTEFTSVEALCHGDWQSMQNLFYDESQRPLIAQIYGRTPDFFWQVAILLCELGFDGIDINMGCPAKSVANGGCGAGLIRTPDKAQAIIQATKAGVQAWQNGATVADCPNLRPPFVRHAQTNHDTLPLAYQQRRPIPVSVKTRIGYDAPVVDAWVSNLLEMEPVAICLHGRTLAQKYSGLANWDEIARGAELAKSTKTLILGNGDVGSLADAANRVTTYGVEGVLIGRASAGNPYLFQPTPADAAQEDDPSSQTDSAPAAVEPQPTLSRPSLPQIALEHARLFEATHRVDQRYRFVPMRKHLAWYIRNIRGAGHLRARLTLTNSAGEVENLLRQQRTLVNGVYQSLLPEN